MIEFGTTEEQFGAVAVACRRHANLDPAAVMHGKPMTMDDYLASPFLADPLLLFDSCLVSDGGAAYVTTSVVRGVAEGVSASGAAGASSATSRAPRRCPAHPPASRWPAWRPPTWTCSLPTTRSPSSRSCRSRTWASARKARSASTAGTRACARAPSCSRGTAGDGDRAGGLAAAHATSSGSPRCTIGVCAARIGSIGPSASVMADSIQPGAIALTRIPWLTTSRASARVSARNPPFAAECAGPRHRRSSP